MNALNFYYARQAEARGLDSLDKLQKLAPDVDRVYDAIVLPRLPQNRAVVIYELACGPGLFLAWLGRRGYHNVTGTDFCENYVRIAQAANLPVQKRDSILDIKSKPDRSVDVICAIDFIEHLPKDVFVEFLFETQRVLKVGGTLLMRAPNPDGLLLGRNLNNDITHFWAYTSDSLGAMAKVLGFRDSEFVDESISPAKGKWRLLWPLSVMARGLLYATLALATRERVRMLGPSYFAFITK